MPATRRRAPRALAVVLAVVLAGLVAGPGAQAQPSVPWTPGVAARHAIEWLVDEAGLGLTTTQWPLPHAAVTRALEALPADLPDRLDAARDLVLRDLQASQRGQWSATVRRPAEALAGFGDDPTPGSSLAVRSRAALWPAVALQVGIRAEALGSDRPADPRLRLDDTALVTQVLGVDLQAWAHRSWWGPGWQSALALSNNAPALRGLGLQRASVAASGSPWLAWLGHWNLAAFIAQTEEAGPQAPAPPYLLGARLTLRPTRFLEIGWTRTAQWGGRGRDNSPGSLLRLITGAGTNADTATEQSTDPGNQMSGFDLRLRCPAGLACVVHGQLIGEDEAGHLPSRYLGAYGVETWSTDGRHRFFAEYAETGCGSAGGRPALKDCAYRNYAFAQGYTSAGRWIGANAGPDTRLLTLGWIDGSAGPSLRLHLGRIGARIGAYSTLVDDPQTSGRLRGLSARHGWSWGSVTVAPELDWWRLASPTGVRRQMRVGVTLRMALD
jgi:hypothetical protein